MAQERAVRQRASSDRLHSSTNEVTTPFPSIMLLGSLLDLGLNENYFHIGAFGFRLNNKSSAIIW